MVLEHGMLEIVLKIAAMTTKSECLRLQANSGCLCVCITQVQSNQFTLLKYVSNNLQVM